MPTKKSMINLTQATWQQAADLSGPVGFGGSVSISGNSALVANMSDAYCYRYNGNIWELQGKLPYEGRSSVRDWSISEEKAIIGDTSEDRAYVYQYNGSSWELQGNPIIGQRGYYFGWSVGISGNKAVIGTQNHSKVFFYNYDGDEWQLQQSPLTRSGYFGYSVDIDGNKAIIGAPNDKKVYICHCVEDRWTIVDQIFGTSVYFGGSVGISGDKIIVNAPNEHKLYLYQYNGYAWQSEGIFDKVAGEHIDIDGSSIIIGKHEEKKAYIYTHTITQGGGNGQSGDQGSGSSQGNSALSTFRSTYPIDFVLTNQNQEEGTLFIEDEPTTQQVTLTLTNQIPKTLTLQDLGNNVSSTNYHFSLSFRPDTLSSTFLDNVQQANSAKWKLTATKEDPATHIQTLYLLYTGSDKSWAAQDTKSLHLQGINANALGGTRGTRIELQYQKLHTQTPLDQDEEIKGKRIQYLNIINHHGHKDIPLHVGFIGNNHILNDGHANNSLKLRITNTLNPLSHQSGPTDITFKKDNNTTGEAQSKIIVYFDQGDQEWALGTSSQVAGITLECTNPYANINESPESDTSQWTLTFSQDTTLAPKAHLEIDISNIVSSSPDGQTNLYVHYENIPGYWDGQFVALIEKAPLVYSDQKVGIGTNSPQAKLCLTNNNESTVALDFRSDDGTTNHKDYSAARIQAGWESNKTNWSDSFLKLDNATNNNTYSTTMTLKNGKVGIGTDSPAQKLHVAGNTYVTGKVGVGTASPSEKLEVSGGIKAQSHINTQGKLQEKGHSLIPTHTIVMWHGNTGNVPAGWTLCDGTHGTPDLRSRFIVGAGQGDGLYNYSVGIGYDHGREQVTLSVDQMPRHNHSMSHDGAHNHVVDHNMKKDGLDHDAGGSGGQQYYRSNDGGDFPTNTDGAHSHTINYTGSGQPHENRPPYYALCFIMKID